MFFPKDIQEIPDSDTPAEKLFFAQAALPDTNTLGGGRSGQGSSATGEGQAI